MYEDQDTKADIDEMVNGGGGFKNQYSFNWMQYYFTGSL